MPVEYPLWRLSPDGALRRELLKQPPTLSAQRAPGAVVVRPVAGRPPPGPPVAAERLFLPADPAANSDVAGCSVRSRAGMLVIVCAPGEGADDDQHDEGRPVLGVVEVWSSTTLIFNELHAASVGGWRRWEVDCTLLTPVIPVNQVSGPPLVGIKLDAFDLAKAIARPSTSGPDGIGSRVLWGDALETEPSIAQQLPKHKRRRLQQRERRRKGMAASARAPPIAPTSAAPTAATPTAPAGAATLAEPRGKGGELEGCWLLESPKTPGKFYALPGELALPRQPVFEDWFALRALHIVQLQEQAALLLLGEDGVTILVREYANVEAIFEGVDAAGMREHVNLSASIANGFTRGPGAHRMVGAMDLQGQRRQRSSTVFKQAGEQTTYTTGIPSTAKGVQLP